MKLKIKKKYQILFLYKSIMLYYVKLHFFAYCPPFHNCFKTFLMVHCMANIWYYHTYIIYF